ncbi:hypothetical protein ACVNIS_13080 [Sphaerotilaceae bacterium SBD11-9]
MKKPFRFWMTSGVAIMVAAVSGGRSFAAEERVAPTRLSRFSVSETVQRIEATAQRHGMHVLACLPQQLHAATGESRPYMIVLESSQGGTPVQMETADAQPDLLLSVYLKPGRQGTEVFLHEGALRDLPEDLPAQVQSDLADLPAMLDEALSA